MLSLVSCNIIRISLSYISKNSNYFWDSLRLNHLGYCIESVSVRYWKHMYDNWANILEHKIILECRKEIRGYKEFFFFQKLSKKSAYSNLCLKIGKRSWIIFAFHFLYKISRSFCFEGSFFWMSIFLSLFFWTFWERMKLMWFSRKNTYLI